MSRQLKNITEQISIIENRRDINAEILAKYLPVSQYRDLPVLYRSEDDKKGISERDLLYKVLFDMKKDIHDLKKVVGDILQNEDTSQDIQTKNTQIFKQFNPDFRSVDESLEDNRVHHLPDDHVVEPIEDSVVIEESLSIQEKEIDLIRKALARHHGKRKVAAKELGISERTLYRKIKEYDIV